MKTRNLIESDKSPKEIVSELSEQFDFQSTMNLESNPQDLVDIANTKLGWAVAEQLEDLFKGQGFSEQNINALGQLKTFAQDRGEWWLADAISYYMSEGNIEFLSEYE